MLLDRAPTTGPQPPPRFITSGLSVLEEKAIGSTSAAVLLMLKRGLLPSL